MVMIRRFINDDDNAGIRKGFNIFNKMLMDTELDVSSVQNTKVVEISTYSCIIVS